MFEGASVALVTPFKNGAIDEQALSDLIERQIAGGVTTLVPCGTTGESATLSYEEHARVVELTVQRARKRVRVLAGTGSNSTRETIDLTRHAQEAGVDGALLITPYYNKPTQKGLIAHYSAVAQAVSLPLVVYNVPGRTAVNLLPSTVIELARKEKSVVGIKEASGSMDQASEIIQALGPSFEVISGDDSLTLPLLALGACGVISVAANLVPEDVSGLCRAWARGDVAGARALHLKLFSLCRILFVETNPIPVKTAMGLLDRCLPELRLPLVGMERGHEEQLTRVLKDYGLLKGV